MQTHRRLLLKKKLSFLPELPAHIVTFRGHLAGLATTGQALLSFFPVFHQYTLVFTVANGALVQQTFEAYAAYVFAQHSNILAHSNLRPFVGNLAGYMYEDRASENDVMGETLFLIYIYPPNPHQYPTANAMYPYYC